jgi:hypothetical protein
MLKMIRLKKSGNNTILFNKKSGKCMTLNGKWKELEPQKKRWRPNGKRSKFKKMSLQNSLLK